MRVVLQPDGSLPLVAINLWYHVGSKNEQPGRTGFAHLFEHMLFQGSENVGTNDHFKYVQQVGGVANGSTWFDRTNYYETLPSSSLDLGLWLESDRMGFLLPAMTREKLDNQREVVINERRQRVDNQPYGLAMERLHEILYPPDFPYHWPVIGYLEDLENATLEDVTQFFDTHYVPSNAVLSLVGDFSPQEALDRVERYFGGLRRAPVPPAVEATPEPLEKPRREILEDDVELTRLYLGFQGVSIRDRQWHAADLLTTVLADGKASPLYRDLVYERQLAQEVALMLYPTELVGTLLVIATVKPGVEATEVEEAIWSHLTQARRAAVAEDDLERAKSKVLTGHFESLQHLENRADLLSQSTVFFDDPERLLTEVDRYLAVTGEDILAAATKLLEPSRHALVTVVPRHAP